MAKNANMVAKKCESAQFESLDWEIGITFNLRGCPGSGKQSLQP